MTAHAKLSPSAAERWLTCTAAPRMEENFPNETSVYAEEGTFAHQVAETCTAYAVGNIAKSTYTRRLNKFKTHELFSQELLDYVEEYAQFIKETFMGEARARCKDAFCELEVKLDLSEYVPEGFGTADCIIVSEPVLTVIDFKYGKGVLVSTEENAQMQLYALGALEKYGSLYDITDVKMVIIQPRAGNNNAAERTADELYAWGEDIVKPKAAEAYGENGVLKASDKACRFCRAQGSCRARAEYFTKMFDDNEEAVEKGLLAPKELGVLLEKARSMKTWLDALEKSVFTLLIDGLQVPGWKIVEGKSRRQIADAEEAAKLLRETGAQDSAIFETKLKTITALEKLLGKRKLAEVLAPVIVKPPGKPTVAEITDPRPEYSPEDQVTAAFDEE